ncbi:MAG TPA: hypothetical protein VFQ43_06055 [Nitrososphaera sp.]|nr:MAG: hypothetical protein DME22_13735 [Verrucomicrobiota bacterium]PYK00439.1 MAG: hypothetical protein DME23_07180 [Verrucomicrobiota bacterium]HEU0047148.1 hypothetical protein [Nitrososphaera sp.]
MKKIVPFGGISLATVVLFFVYSCLVRSGSTDLALQAQLVWGTNNDKPDDPKLKEVDAKVTERLRTALKWKNYFEVNRQNFIVRAGTPKKVKMSDHCEIEVENFGNSSIEVKLYGKGKMVVKKTQKIKPGELLIFAGDDKNDTAWFVVLSQSEK